MALVDRQAELATILASLRTAIGNCNADIATLQAADVATVQSYPSNGRIPPSYAVPATWQQNPDIPGIAGLLQQYLTAIQVLGRTS